MKYLNLSKGIEGENLDPGGNMFNTGSRLFQWPPVTKEMRDAGLDVLEHFSMSGTDLTQEFERRFAQWHGVPFALGHSSGTASLHSAMYGIGLGEGDELIAPSITYWASCVQATNLGASVLFADIEKDTLCINPDDIEHRITPRTKAIVVVHYLGHPADMDRILPIARKHNLKVIEDVSHAHGSLYKGRMCGTFGDVAGFSLMSAKSFAIGEAGMLLTSDRRVYERAIAFAHHERHGQLTDPELLPYKGLPLGGFKYRMHQMSSAIGIEMMRIFPELMREVDAAMTYFWNGLEGVPGIRAHRPSKWQNSTMGAWYCPHGHYLPEELDGLSVGTFCRALNAEGIVGAAPGCNTPLHTHELFRTADVYHSGHPTNFSGTGEKFPVASGIQERIFFVPWFKKYDRKEIDRYIKIFRKVVEHHTELLALDTRSNAQEKRWMLSPHEKMEKK